ncbi:MAG: hypothetical protein LBH56_02390 [Coriobacteriales bacterium]|nr:hypothetical protein [Coriobacteriales bacterium]
MNSKNAAMKLSRVATRLTRPTRKRVAFGSKRASMRLCRVGWRQRATFSPA